MKTTAILSAAFCAALTVSTAAAQTTPTTFYACVDKLGNIVMSSATDTCRPNQTRIQWNNPGPAGPKGDKGDPGFGSGAAQWVDATGAVIGPFFPNSTPYWKTPLGLVEMVFAEQASRAEGTFRKAMGTAVGVYYTSTDCSGPAYHWDEAGPRLRGDLMVVSGGLITPATALFTVRMDQPSPATLQSMKFMGTFLGRQPACINGAMQEVPDGTCIRAFSPGNPCHFDVVNGGGTYPLEFVTNFPFVEPFRVQ